ncbi:MAG: hypothetical protein GF381_02135 [Candidatus Pacebacteria bacterium]|nr:hypothetical protein [Candidatus Paceibacterota bacterium]
MTSLRNRHPQFIYHSYQYRIDKGALQIEFEFELKPGIKFAPEIIIPGVTRAQLAGLDQEQLDRLVFFVGLAEIPSYWKAACSPEIVIKAGQLTQAELKFWWNLLLEGMGEFFYQNQIEFTQPGFLRWHFEERSKSGPQTKSALQIIAQSIPRKTKPASAIKRLVPVGGGKDSALMLSLLDQANLDYGCLILTTDTTFSQGFSGWGLADQEVDTPKSNYPKSNDPKSDNQKSRDQELDGGRLAETNQAGAATNQASSSLPAAEAVAAASQANQVIRVNRKIDSTLLRLNAKGYLNGHVPFSAYLSFLTWLIAYLWDYDQILVGNERSANQGNIEYQSQTINHQYSKSYQYERSFRQYQAETELDQANQINYFSFLRPLYELQIAQIFSRYPRYHKLFTSCNRGQKQGVWCHQCPKCLFVYTILYPFFDYQKLTTKIFRSDLFENKNLIPLALDLAGAGELKPFECVGTFEESLIAFYLAVKKISDQSAQEAEEALELPPVLAAINQQLLSQAKNLPKRAEKLLSAWNKQHHLPSELEKLLKKQV